MLMMRGALGSDGSQMCGAWNQIVHRISSLAADPADADDAQCFGSDRSKLIQLMLMMRGAWDKIGRNMMRVLGTRSFTGLARMQLIQLMLMMRSAWDQIVQSYSS